ncbi:MULTISPECIES: GntR family transcriptional regulator [Acutalibacteraceae]|uniref:GntR family transcriptional regulator n=1 Tax=Acutalibacteraceae TaxID=3082771 RepID=UPI0013E8D5E0|nr:MULTISPECIES: GntR family transcriptional regulator [Acutalibacteraceae]
METTSLSLKEKAYAIIKSKIASCEYLPNTFLNEGFLQNEIGVSRTPIRDAISRLEQENLVRIIPKKGIVVSDLSINEISSVYEIRALIEPFAITKYGDKVDKEILLRYKNDFSGMQDAPDSLYRMDDRMHRIFISATQNRYLIQMYDNILVQNGRIRILSGNRNESRIAQSSAEHVKILEAALSDRFDLAAQFMMEHLQAAKNAAFALVVSNGGWEIPQPRGEE